jgi:DNA-binding NtrC family response regulator
VVRASGAMTKILLVEDDPLEARLILPLLEREFGKVERATDAAEALCAIERADFAEQLKLVITGQNMNGIGKPEFVAELHDRLPELQVLVLGTPGESAKDYLGENVEFLSRPLAPRQVVTAAGKMLSRDKSPAL